MAASAGAIVGGGASEGLDEHPDSPTVASAKAPDRTT